MSWMLILLNLCFSFSLWANCELKDPSKKIVSLSGPVTILFKELGLLNSLDGISVFHPISKTDFKGTIYPGGIFLASKTLESLKGKVVFFDESRELRQLLGSVSDIKLVEIKTRSLLPHKVSEHLVKETSSIFKGCEKKLESFIAKTLALEKSLMSSLQGKPRMIFFVGDMVMAHDGVVILLKENHKIETYPSELPYVSWSAKMMNRMKDFRKVHLKDSNPKLKKDKSDGSIEVFFPGILIPGLSQLEGFSFLFSGDRLAKP